MVLENSDRLLSICIATRGRSEILINTLSSIFQSDTDSSLYEVVVYDSSEGGGLNSILEERFETNNLRYIKGENFGYMNLIHALKLGSGKYLKMHNDYSCFIEGSLEVMISEVKAGLEKKPLLVFSNGSFNDIKQSTYSSFNDFLYSLSFYSTWSNVFGIWKTDLDILNDIELNPMFPHTSVLFAMSYKNSYKIENSMLFSNVAVLNKGGYNLFSVFANDYLGMVEDCYKAEKITDKTFDYIKSDMFYNFFIPWYSETRILKNSYTFSLSGIKNSMRTYYSALEYYKMIFCAYGKSFKKILRDFLKR